MTIDELCNKYDCTEEEREQVYIYLIFLWMNAFALVIFVLAPFRVQSAARDVLTAIQLCC